MMDFISENIVNIIIIAIVAAIFMAILVRQIKRFKNHSGCSCGCGDCHCCDDMKKAK